MDKNKVVEFPPVERKLSLSKCPFCKAELITSLYTTSKNEVITIACCENPACGYIMSVK